MKSRLINIYTDGASRGNPGPGGYGAILELPGTSHRKELSGGFRRTTNNRMELLAVIEALEQLKSTGYQVNVYTDSRYVSDAIEKRWLDSWVKKGFKGKKNEDLWRRYLPLHERFRPKFIWIKGHNNHPQNERCDELAVQAALQGPLQVDEGYEAAG